jgi:hypothetical protein
MLDWHHDLELFAAFAAGEVPERELRRRRRRHLEALCRESGYRRRFLALDLLDRVRTRGESRGRCYAAVGLGEALCDAAGRAGKREGIPPRPFLCAERTYARRANARVSPRAGQSLDSEFAPLWSVSAACATATMRSRQKCLLSPYKLVDTQKLPEYRTNVLRDARAR